MSWSGSRKYRQQRGVSQAKGGIKSDINVTPLVDVMLVLLIIMMIVAPLLQKGADVKLPVAAYSSDKPETQGQTVVAVDSQGRFFVNGVPVREEASPTRRGHRRGQSPSASSSRPMRDALRHRGSHGPAPRPASRTWGSSPTPNACPGGN
ncbi:MAG: biopolymer transporter ExbD [Vicinamibacterales bacterium]